jgi:peptidoglycan hydrolase-like protein with peptidoglycan-binding domain
LTVGAQGDQVKELQKQLMAFGVYVPGGADGVFGPATKTAVSHFQRWNGLPVTGAVDSATAAKLKLVGSSGGGGGSTPSGVASTAYVGLKNGARGAKVKELQQALIRAGISVRGGADGVFGPYTAAALTSYQQAQGLAATGVVDDQVVSRLGLGSGGSAAPAPAAPAAPASPSANYAGLKVGSTGPLVKDLQRALMNTGLTLLGGADGVFGNATRSTLILFQRVNGFPQTGEVSARDASTLGLGGGSPAPQGVAGGGGFAVYGERGARVKTLQQSLLKAGISFAGGADGVFGAATAGAILTFQRREGLPATGKVDEATAKRLSLAAAGAPAPPSSAGVSMDVFPVQGQCWFGDTWQAPRGGGRTHEGTDIIAAKGNLLYAVVSGTISKMYYDYPGALSGNGFRIAHDNGTYFTYLHLDSFAPGIDVGTKVKAGQVVGYVGSTGNSATPHLHFEIHPNGGAGINPYSLLKQIDACNVTAPRG